jgi:hypothetical protein
LTVLRSFNPLTFGAICLQFFKQSVMQSGFADAGETGNKNPEETAAALQDARKFRLVESFSGARIWP